MFGTPSRRATIGRRRLVIIITVAAVAGIFAFLLFTGRLPMLSVGGVSTRTISGIVPQSVVGNSQGFVYSEGSEVHLLSTAGQERWVVDVGLSEVTTCASDDLILNYSGPNLQAMLYSKEQLFLTSVDSPILEGAAGKEYVAVLIDAPEDNAGTQQMIYLFNRAGQKTGQLSFSRQVIDFGFFSDDTMTDLFWTLSLDTAGTAPMSYITMYNKANGEMTYSITISARVIEKVIVTSNLIYASGSGALTAYTYFGEAQASEPVPGWKIGAYVSGTTALDMAYVPRAEAASIESVRTFSSDGVSGMASFESARFGLPMGILGVAVTPSSLYALSNDTLYVYTLGGELQRSQPLGLEITGIKQVSSEYCVLWGSRDTHVLRLQ